MFDLTGKVAVVTGGGSGIGESISEVLGYQGAKVCILDINPASAALVKKQIELTDGEATVYPCDVSDQAAVLRVMEDIFNTHGSIDILVNNAGVAHIGTAETTTEADFDRLMGVNVKGVYNCIHAVIPWMKRRDGGSIINMASVAAMVGLPDRFAYSVTKGAVLTMTYSVAKDYVEAGIRCNAVSPARVHTPFVDNYLKHTYPGREAEVYATLAATQPIGRMGKPEEVAGLVLYLASDEAAFITGTNFPIDGGFVTLNT